MPLASAKTAAPVVDKPAEVKTVGTGESVRDLREQSKIQGQIRTHLVAHAMPNLLSTVDLTDESAVKALINKYARFVETGE